MLLLRPGVTKDRYLNSLGGTVSTDSRSDEQPSEQEKELTIPDVVLNGLSEGLSDLPQRKQASVLSAKLVLGVGCTVVAAVVAIVVAIVLAKPQAAAQQEAVEELDQEKPPFTVSINDNPDPPSDGPMVLDEPLKPAEVKKLQSFGGEDGDEARKYLESLGARYVYTLSGQKLPPSASPGVVDLFTMNIFGKRTNHISITSMQAVNVSCAPSKGKTIVDFPSAGADGNDGVIFDLTSSDPVPYVFGQDKDHEAEPYFNWNSIHLASGDTPAGLAVHALLNDKSCHWEIETEYTDDSGKTRTTVVNNDGKPFFAEALPENPQQYWAADILAEDSERFVPCHEDPEPSLCPDRS